MVEKGLIEKEMSSPQKYSIVPLEVALSLLLTRKQSQISQLELEAQKVMKKLGRSHHKDTLQNQDSNFTVVTGRNLLIERIKKSLSKTQISVEIVTTRKRFQVAILEFGEFYRQALERGVQIRFATEENGINKETQRVLTMLGKYPNFKVHFLPESIPTIAAIYDAKEVYVCFSVAAHLAGAEGLCSNNRCFVVVAQTYFEAIWKNPAGLIYLI